MSWFGFPSLNEEPEIKIEVQVVYLGDDPRKHRLGSGEGTQERQGSQKRVSHQAISSGPLGLSPGSPSLLWERVKHSLELSHLSGAIGVFISQFG